MCSEKRPACAALFSLSYHCWIQFWRPRRCRTNSTGPSVALPSTIVKNKNHPLITYSAGGKALGYSLLSGIFKTLRRQILPVASAELFTWHSFRSGLACALRPAQAPDWVLLALLRWRSKSSIPGYGRLSFLVASAWLDQTSAQN
jgi:hypothetical protein